MEVTRFMESYNYKFTKAHTQIAKGIAILLMICHHLFAFPDRLSNVNFSSIIPFSNKYFELQTGIFGKVCVSMFLFLSGYGLYISYIKNGSFKFKNAIKKMKMFLFNYWIVFILFVPVGLIWFNYSRNFSIFLSNFFLLSTSYNGEWWFARLYIELLLLFPIIKYFLNKNAISFFIVSIILCLLPVKINMLFQILPQLLFVKNTLFYTDLIQIAIYQPIFLLGCLTVKYDLFKVVNSYLFRKKLNKKCIYIIGIYISVVARLNIPKLYNIDASYVDILITPIIILFCTNLISVSRIKSVFIILGKHSGNMWLTHTFFIYYYFQRIVFYPKISVLIVIWVCVLSLASSIIINFIISKLNNIYYYINSRVKLLNVYEEGYYRNANHKSSLNQFR